MGMGASDLYMFPGSVKVILSHENLIQLTAPISFISLINYIFFVNFHPNPRYMTIDLTQWTKKTSTPLTWHILF